VTHGHGFANHDLEVVFLVVPVPDIAAVDADDDRCLRKRWPVPGPPSRPIGCSLEL
jgi:hypothetical protein